MKKWGLHRITTIPPASVLSTLFLLDIVITYHFFHVNNTIAIITTTAAVITSALYIWSTIAPIHDPQSLYQSPLSELTWQVIQMTSRWTCRYTGGPHNHTRTNMMDACEQLAMDKSDDRQNWDARAICSMIEGLTEESKLETFVNSIPGTFNLWGQEVWGIIAAEDKRAGVSTPQPNAETDVAVRVISHSLDGPPSSPMLTLPKHENTIAVLTLRITNLLKTYVDHGVLLEKEVCCKHIHACIAATLSFVLSIGDDWHWYNNPEVMSQALVYLGDVEMVHTPTNPHFDVVFSVHWVCMALIFVQKMLNTSLVQSVAHLVITQLAEMDLATDASGDPDSKTNEDETAASASRTIDRHLKTAWGVANTCCSDQYCEMEDLGDLGLLDKDANRVLNDALEPLNLGLADKVDQAINDLMQKMLSITGHVLGYIPTAALSLRQNSSRMSVSTAMIRQFFPPLFCTQQLSHGTLSLDDLLGDLSVLPSEIMMAQLWRLQDTRNGSYVFVLELFMAAVCASTVSLHPSSQEIFINTFKRLTDNWEIHQNVLCTQHLLVYLL